MLPIAQTPFSSAASPCTGVFGLPEITSAPCATSAATRVLLLARIDPGVDPNDLQRRVRIDAARAEHEGVEAVDHLRHRESADPAEDVGLGHAAGGDAGEISAFVVPRLEYAEIVAGLDAGAAFEMRALDASARAS